MPRRNFRKTIVLLFCAILTAAACVGCGGGTGNEELAARLADEIVDEGTTNIERALVRVDSAEQARVFTAVHANTVKAMIYENADQRRMAVYYAEKAIAAEDDSAPWLKPHPRLTGELKCMARWILADGAYANGEYGKSIALAKEILAFVGDEASPKDVAMKCRALSQMAECESELKHVDEAERLFLQCIDLMMESTQHTNRCDDIDPLIYTLLVLNDLYIDNGMPERALSLMAKMDTAINRLTRCSNDTDWVLQTRRNNVTISKAIVYAANNQQEQAEALFRKHQQSPGLDAADKTVEGVYLTMKGRYDEAIRVFDEADSLMRASGDPITDIYVKNFLNHKYNALQQSGRTAEALAMSNYMRQLTDSMRQQERKADVEQLQEIKRQEEENIRKRQSLTTYRIFLVATIVQLLMAIYIIWRVRRDNRLLTEKNHSLYEQIQQRAQAEAEEQRQLQEMPEESLTSEQQLYRRLCTLMTDQQPYTDENLNRDTLAQLLSTNAKYVVQAIRECSHGETVMDFIIRYRLEHVAHLLKTTDQPIAIVGELSGIPSRATLARLFRNAYGMSCSEYRQVSQRK